MNRYFVITIDVEPDCTPNWRYSDPLTFDGVHIGIKEKLQVLFNKYDACPTYLINNVVLEDARSTETFINLEGNFELGTHLHAEFIEPQKEFDDYAGKKGEANQCSYAPDIEFGKMKNITQLFENNFGYKPLSFRAGRFSAGANTIKCLETLGYKVDTSVTPHVKWHDKTRTIPVDNTNAYEQPYFIKENSILEKSTDGKILEVPVSIIESTRFFRKKALWLRPYYSGFNDFLKVMNVQMKTYRHNDNIVFNLMFHNVEVLPKLSPYTQTENDCKNYLALLEQFLSHCKKNNIKSAGLSTLYDVYGKNR